MSGPALVVRARGRVSLPLPRRPLATTLGLLAAAFGVAVLGLGWGDIPIAPDRVVAVLLGGGDYYDRLVLTEYRLPAVLCGLLVGAAHGLAGAIFQSLTRNPLGSPDIIGFGTGSATGALVLIVIVGAGAGTVALGALAGGAVTALAVYALARQAGGGQGHTLVLVGIGTGAMLAALNGWLVSLAEVESAAQAQGWLLGSLNGRSWAQTELMAVALVGLAVAAVPLARTLRTLELGEDAAQALGVRVLGGQRALLAVGTALVAAATATAGPIVFVALVAPQLARRLSGDAGPALAASAAMGAVLLVAADVVARHAVPGMELPVGICTAALGGTYLVGLLISEHRSGRG